MPDEQIHTARKHTPHRRHRVDSHRVMMLHFATVRPASTSTHTPSIFWLAFTAVHMPAIPRKKREQLRYIPLDFRQN